MSVQYFIAASALGAFLILLIQKLFKTKVGFWEERGIPELKVSNQLLRSLKSETFQETYAALYKQLGDRKYGGIYESGNNVVFVKDLDLVKQIFVKDFDHFVNRNIFPLNDNDETWNDMLMSKVNKEWKDLRATMTPTFTSGKLRRMFLTFQESGQKMTTYFDIQLKENEKVNIEDGLGRYCLDSILSLAFGIDSEIFENENSIVAKKATNLVLTMTPFLILRSFLFGLMPSWVSKMFQPTFLNQGTTEFFSKMIKTTIAHREKTGETRNDFLQLLLDAKHGQLKKDEEDTELGTYEKDAQLKENKSSKDYVMTDDLIASNCMLFLIAGFDTTKNAIALAAYCMAMNPDVQEKLRLELQEATEENGGELSYDIINTHVYLDKVVNEVLRMFPAGVRQERTCTKDYTIPDTKSFIPKGSRVWVPTYEIHHDEKHFPNHSKFDPERFSPEVKSTRHAYAYMAFGHGPRNCIANRLALVMTKAALSSLILNFCVQPTAETNIPLKFSNTLLTALAEPIQLKLTARK